MKSSKIPKIHVVKIRSDGDDMPSDEFCEDRRHFLRVQVDEKREYAALHFSTRSALYELGRTIIHEALFGESGRIEFQTELEDGIPQVVNGVRLDKESCRIFILYGKDSALPASIQFQ